MDKENNLLEADKEKTPMVMTSILLIFAIVAAFFRESVIAPIGTAAALVAIYYLISKRKVLEIDEKRMGWILVVVWIVIYSWTSGSFKIG